ncbi:hypothetical protein ACSQ67_016369 [Phaseolus vulgaris]
MDSWVRVLLFIACIVPALVECKVRHYKFNVVLKNTTRLCSSKPIVTVNGKFPGPTLYAREDDTVLVKVRNLVNHNVTIHWRMVEIDIEDVINEALKSRLAPNVSDAHTINGLPWTVSVANCSTQVVVVDNLICYDHIALYLELLPPLLQFLSHLLQEMLHKVFTTDFPGNPPQVYNYTATQRLRVPGPQMAPRFTRLAFNSTVRVVLQDTGVIAPESHPIHLHGFNFFVVGSGVGNYDPKTDASNFNLECGSCTRHFEVHTTWGLKMAFLVDNGKGPNESLIAPPNDLPKC